MSIVKRISEFFLTGIKKGLILFLLFFKRIILL